MSLYFVLAIYIYFALYFQCGYSKVYDVESEDLPYDFAYHIYNVFPYVEFFCLEKAYKTSVKCSKDSQCFTNKYVNNDCLFNENGDIKLCVDGHCGRFMGDPCTTRDECAKGDCDGVCHYPEQSEGETDIEYTLKFLSTLGFLIIIVIIVCCVACYNSNTKVSNTESNKQYTGIN
ncbi:hypothetical protein H8356DRAFT_1271089 [Neocallimastix lanati (nom. inval.)]|nr:hypothetical protein H8356DRAFT_1271089 [Neocallimastix sp. JGI-2020a]